MSSLIHPTAIVAPSAQLGDGVSVGAYAIIEDDVVIGDNCTIHAQAQIKQYTRMGKGNTVHSFAIVGGTPQDLKFHGEVSAMVIGDNNTIREFATLHRGTEGGGALTSIGSNNLIMAYCHIAHDCKVGNNVVMSNNATLAGHVEVHDFAIIGGLSAVHQFVRIGTHSFVGGMTGISMDLPPYMLAVGNRAGLNGPNIVGLRRMKVPTATITAMRNIYRIIWLSGTPRQEALAQVKEEYGEIGEVQLFLGFIHSSERGVLSVQRGNLQD